MASQRRNLYADRRVLRTLEKIWSRLEGGINKLAGAGERIRPYNPLYHLGTLSIFLLIVLLVTGIYLTIFYRPGIERAYASVQGINQFWLGNLMRSIHRYASDGLILVTLLHALKMLVSDRFWGNRWLAWVSGWGLLALFWAIGVMGYWLVWDQPAQWLTEYVIGFLSGSFALSFFGPNVAAGTFSLFVIVLFLHIFLPILIVIGIIIHVLRLTRVKIWTPRWLTVETGLVLVILSLIRPVTMALPADLSRLVTNISVDWWYMGFLPLTAQLGSPLFWGLSLLLLGGLSALPWLWQGQHVGPAEITNPNCTGCALCARECPFDAIQMVPRHDGTRYRQLAVMRPDLCTGCGICVGTCSTSGIELGGLHSVVIREDISRVLAESKQRGVAPTVIFTCDRQLALGSLPIKAEPETAVPTTSSQPVIPLLEAKAPRRVQAGVWSNGKDAPPLPVVTAPMPCVGMLHPQWVREATENGANGVLVLGCPGDDCNFREGPHWLHGRLARRRSLRKENVRYVEMAPGDPKQVTAVLQEMTQNPETAVDVYPTTRPKEEKTGLPFWLSQTRYLAAGLVVLLFVFGASLLLDRPLAPALPQEGLLRLGLSHGGELIAAAENLPPEIREKIPANTDPAMVLGGERFPVRLRVQVNGETILEETYEPRGLRREGAIEVLETYWLPPGEHQINIWLIDDGADWQQVFADTVTIPENGARTLLFDEASGTFERDRK